MPTVTADSAKLSLSSFLWGRSAEDMGWPHRKLFAQTLAAAVAAGSGVCLDAPGESLSQWRATVLEPAMLRLLPAAGTDDIRGMGWPNVYEFAAAVIDTLVAEGVITA